MFKPGLGVCDWCLAGGLVSVHTGVQVHVLHLWVWWLLASTVGGSLRCGWVVWS